MAYIGNQPANTFVSTDKQSLTGNGTTGPYTLSHSVTSDTDIEVYVNNVRQRPGSSHAYTVNGNQLTMTGAVSATDDFYVVFQGRGVGTVGHPANAGLSATTGTFNGNVSVTGNITNTGNTDTKWIDVRKRSVDTAGGGRIQIRPYNEGIGKRFAIDNAGPTANSERLRFFHENDADGSGGQVIMEMHADRHISMPAQPYGRYTFDTITPFQNTDTKVLMTHQAGQDYRNAARDRITVPIAGRWLITWSLLTDPEGAHTYIGIKRNGGLIFHAHNNLFSASGTSNCDHQGSHIVDCNANDYFEWSNLYQRAQWYGGGHSFLNVIYMG